MHGIDSLQETRKIYESDPISTEHEVTTVLLSGSSGPIFNPRHSLAWQLLFV